MKRALLVMCVGVLACVALAVDARVNLRRGVGNADAVAVVGGVMFGTYGIARVRRQHLIHDVSIE